MLGPIAPLTDVVVHTHDIARPLSIDVVAEPTTHRQVLDFLCGGRAVGFVPRRGIRGLRFEAHELGWSIGAGPVVAGSGATIMLAVTGRPAGLDQVTGAGGELLRERLAPHDPRSS